MPPKPNFLREAIADLRATPFPKSPLDENGSELHARLAEFDGHTNGLLERVMSGEKQLPFQLRPDPALRTAIEHLRDRSAGDIRAGASSLLAYLAILERAIQAAQSEIASE